MELLKYYIYQISDIIFASQRSTPLFGEGHEVFNSVYGPFENWRVVVKYQVEVRIPSSYFDDYFLPLGLFQ